VQPVKPQLIDGGTRQSDMGVVRRVKRAAKQADTLKRGWKTFRPPSLAQEGLGERGTALRQAARCIDGCRPLCPAGRSKCGAFHASRVALGRHMGNRKAATIVKL
jgi:hypothetical protein